MTLIPPGTSPQEINWDKGELEAGCLPLTLAHHTPRKMLESWQGEPVPLKTCLHFQFGKGQCGEGHPFSELALSLSQALAPFLGVLP